MALAECCILDPGALLGADISVNPKKLRPDFALFGEDQSRIVVSVAVKDVDRMLAVCRNLDVPAERIGTVGGAKMKINDGLEVACSELAGEYHGAIDRALAL